MFEINKTKYPNLWFLVKLGSLFHANKQPYDICSLVRRVFIGVLFSMLIPIIINLIIGIVIDFPILILYECFGPYHGITSGLTTFLSGIVWVVALGAVGMGVIFMVGALIIILAVETLRRYSTTKPKGFLSTWYEGFKGKYCTSVKMVDDSQEGR